MRRMGGRFASDAQSASMTPHGMARMNQRMYDTPHAIIVRGGSLEPVSAMIGPFAGSLAAFDFASAHRLDSVNVWPLRSARRHYGAVPMLAPGDLVREA